MVKDCRELIEAIVRSGLLSRPQVEEAVRALPPAGHEGPERMVEHLVEQGTLSQFQGHKLLQGATLGLKLGPYVLQTPIGKGGMGHVYLAVDERSGKHRAIKVLPPRRARKERRQLERFQREMAIAQQVAHPHLCRTIEAGTWQGVYYIAMEYIPGESLYRLVTTKGPLPVGRAARLFTEVAAALEYAHGLGLIHRDLKPSNIMVTPHDHAKVLDLGLALMEGEEAKVEVVGGKGYVVGSVDYMAPEQTHDATKVDARSDLYALGCTLYFALSGKPPFQGSNHKEKVQAQRHHIPDPIQWRNPDVPDAFGAIVDRLLAKDPAERFPTAAALREALKPWRTAEEERPLDQEEDSTFRKAVDEARTGPLSASLADSPLVNPEQEGGTSKEELSLGKLLAETGRRDIYRLGLLLALFWIVVFLLVGVIGMVRWLG